MVKVLGEWLKQLLKQFKDYKTYSKCLVRLNVLAHSKLEKSNTSLVGELLNSFRILTYQKS